MKKFISIFVFLFCNCLVYSQNYFMNGSPIIDCNGIFYDSGGILGSYSDGEDLVTTICPEAGGESHTSLRFNEIGLRLGDVLCFYDGINTDAPEISCILDHTLNGPFNVRASAANTTGCLTISFKSNNTGVGSGWNAAIGCVPACQEVRAVMNSTTPASVPLENGWIDACPNDAITFRASGEYPQNGLIYNQSDASSTFTWDFGDGTTSTGKNVTHRYSEPGGYLVQLVIEDAIECINTNYISQRVRIASPPDIELTGDFPTRMCNDESFALYTNISSPQSSIQVTPNENIFTPAIVFSEELFIPDGLEEYNTKINIANFTPGTVLTDINDLLGICVNMEHSYLYDLDIRITCPSGNSVILQNFEGLISQKVNLGEPIQNLNDPCDNTDPSSGVGYDYCWKKNSGQGTMFAEALFIDDGGTLPAGEYNAFENLENLLGCPLNGEWKISVKDNLACDNGWIFSWGIDFDESLYPDVETFTPAITDWNWVSNPQMTTATMDSLVSSPTMAGQTNYILQMSDEFGCNYDTSFLIEVLPPTHPDCFVCQDNLEPIPDATICEGDGVSLVADYSTYNGEEIGFYVNPEKSIGFANHPPNNPYVSIINVNNIYPTEINNVNADLASICVNIETDATGEIALTLTAPSGESMNLVANIGAQGDNFFNTCFTPTANTAIIAGNPPFTGNYQPIGDWSTIEGSDVNGDWILEISDKEDPNEFGILKDWSIHFNASNDETYSWTNENSLSCGDCAEPYALPTTTTNYAVIVEDGYNCQMTQDVDITVIPNLPAPDAQLLEMTAGIAYFSWTAIPEAAGYEVNINGQGWKAPTGTLTHQEGGFMVEDPVEFMVRAYSLPLNCTNETWEIRTQFDTCYMNVSPGLLNDIRCHGETNGLVSMNVQGNGEPPFTYFLNGGMPQSLNTYTNLGAGNYTLTIEDSRGCRDSINVTITEPDPLEVTTSTIPTLCDGSSDGTFNAAGEGGTQPYNYSWTINPIVQDSFSNSVPAGNYTVRVTDDNGCIVEEEVEVLEPDPISVTMDALDASCAGGSDGEGIAIASGGTPGYTYLWNDPSAQTSPTAMNLSADNYFLTVTDANMCTGMAQVQVDEPDPATATVTMTPVSCFGGANGTATVANMGPTPHTYLWDDPMAQTTQTADGLIAGTFNVTLTDANGCISIGTIMVEEPMELELTLNPSTSLCVGSADGSATVLASGGTGPYTYLWDDPLAQTTNTASNIAAGNYSVTVTDSRDCIAIGSTTIQNPTPIVLQMDSTFTSCVTNADGTATVMASGGAGGFTYQWDDIATQTSPTAINLQNGLFTVVVTDASNCTSSEDVNIITENPLEIDTITTVGILCNGDNNGEAQVFVEGGNGPYSYVWSDMNGQFSNPAISLIAGTYQVTVTDINDCFDIGTVEVIQPDVLETVMDSTNVNCFGENTGMAAVTPSGGLAPYSYIWAHPGTPTDSMAVGLDAGVYSVTVTDFNNCTAENVVMITQPNTAITTSVNQTFIGCFDSATSTAEVMAFGGTGTNYDYLWSNTQTENIATDLGATQYFVTVTDEIGCEMVDSIIVEELDEIMTNIAFIQPSCFGFFDGEVGVNFIEGGTGNGNTNNYDYEWNTFPVQMGGVATNLPGNQSYAVTITDSQGCSNIDSIYMTEPSQIMLTTEAIDASCYGMEDGIAAVTFVEGDHNEYTYLWDDKTSNATGSFVESLSIGQYSVTVTDSTGCSVATIVNINQPPEIVVSIDSTNNICNGDTDGTAFARVIGGISPYSYFWSNGSDNRDIENLASDEYFLTVQDANGCQLLDSVQIQEPTAIEVNVELGEITCAGDRDGSIMLETVGGEGPFRYSTDGENFVGNSNLIGLTAGEYDVVVMDDMGCEWDSLIIVEDPPEFRIYLGEDITIESGDSVDLNVAYSNASGVPYFNWLAPYEGTLSCTECKRPTAKPLSTIDYEVYSIDDKGCEDTDFLRIVVQKNKSVLVPTGFSPNGDGRNDMLLVHGKSKSVTEITLFRVYDRWGEQVYEMENFMINDPTVGWDGNFRGQEMNPGMYVWYLEVEYIDGTSESLQGQTNLIR